MEKRIRYIIYALVDPRDNSVHYVGLTDNIFLRLGTHLKEAGSRTEKGRWLQDLLDNELQPSLLTLERMDISRKERHLAEERERYWIQYYHTQGAPLTNIQYIVTASKSSASYRVPSGSSKKQKATRTIKQLQEDAGLWIRELAILAGVSETTIRHMMNGTPVSPRMVDRVPYVLSERLNRRITREDIRGVNYI